MTTTSSTVRLTCAQTAEQLRRTLRHSFPRVTFSVTSHKYSGGASIDVQWSEGPSTADVERIAKRFEGATFDGSIDLKESVYTYTADGRKMRHGADYIFCTRLTAAQAEQRRAWRQNEKAKAAARREETAARVAAYETVLLNGKPHSIITRPNDIRRYYMLMTPREVVVVLHPVKEIEHEYHAFKDGRWMGAVFTDADGTLRQIN